MIAAMTLAVLMVTAGAAAAMPEDVPAASGANEHEQSSTHRPDDPRNKTARDNTNAAAMMNPADDDTFGPPTDMPAAVPDHVSAIHELIVSFLTGELDGPVGIPISDVAHGAPVDGSG